MKERSPSRILRSFIGCLGLTVCLHGQTLRKIGAIDLPGPKGQRFDYLTMDDEDTTCFPRTSDPVFCTSSM